MIKRNQTQNLPFAKHANFERNKFLTGIQIKSDEWAGAHRIAYKLSASSINRHLRFLFFVSFALLVFCPTWKNLSSASAMEYIGGRKPFTLLQPNGDYIVGGMSKTLIQKNKQFRALQITGPITGGFLSSATLDAIICTEHELYTVQFKSSKSFEKQKVYGERIICATNGKTFLVYDGVNFKIFEDLQDFLDDAKMIRPRSRGILTGVDSMINILPWKDHFIAFTQNGKAMILDTNRTWTLEGSLGSVSETTVVRAHEDYIYLLDDNGFYRFSIRDNQITDKARIPVNPCSDGERCGLSVAIDGSYLVAGYWGIWHGAGESLRPERVTNIPILSREGGRGSISHTGRGGYYLYLADDDIDLGRLSPLKLPWRYSCQDTEGIWNKKSLSPSILSPKRLYATRQWIPTLPSGLSRSSEPNQFISPSEIQGPQSHCVPSHTSSDSQIRIPQAPDNAAVLTPDGLRLSAHKRRVVWLKHYQERSWFTWKTPSGQQASVVLLTPDDPIPPHWVSIEEDELIPTPLESTSKEKAYSPSSSSDQPTNIRERDNRSFPNSIGLPGLFKFISPSKDTPRSENHSFAKSNQLLDSLRKDDLNFWWRNRLKIDEILAQVQARPHRLIKVGVIDTGLALSHPSFKDQISVNSLEIPNNGIDDDENGLIDDARGWDFVNDDSVPEDEHGHGTHVTGLIAGKFLANEKVWQKTETKFPMPIPLKTADKNLLFNGALGPAADYAQLIIAKGLGSKGSSNSLDLARAVVYAVDQGSNIINCSWGGGFPTQVIQDAIQYALEKGVIVMMSAGNSGIDNDKSAEFPKKIAGLTIVASSNEKNQKPKHSNFGKNSVTWAVPGDQILSTTLDGKYGFMSGTSMANGISTGLAALALSFTPVGTESSDVISRLCNSSDQSGWIDKTRCGHINLKKYFLNLEMIHDQ